MIINSVVCNDLFCCFCDFYCLITGLFLSFWRIDSGWLCSCITAYLLLVACLGCLLLLLDLYLIYFMMGYVLVFIAACLIF